MSELQNAAEHGDTWCICLFLFATLSYLVATWNARKCIAPDLSLFAIGGGVSSVWAFLLVTAAATEQLPWDYARAKAYTIVVSLTLGGLYGADGIRSAFARGRKSTSAFSPPP